MTLQVGAIISVLLQIRKLKHTEVKQLAQSHAAGKMVDLEFELSLTSEPAHKQQTKKIK